MSLSRKFQWGRHFLQIPGPTNVPDDILEAIRRPVTDHRGPEFAEMTRSISERLQAVFKTLGPVVLFPSSGTGAWEAGLVNVLSPGDRVLAFETGHFAVLWAKMAEGLGLTVDLEPGDWRSGVSPELVQRRLEADRERAIRAVLVVHNETSTGVVSPVPIVRQAIDAAGHPALLLVDTISSLGSMDYRHDEWGVDVTVGASQKGLMLPPGLGFNAMSPTALAAAEESTSGRSYWDWGSMLAANEEGFFPYTPATNLLYGLDRALDRLLNEGLEMVFARHARHGEATRRAVRRWGLEIQCADPQAYSASVTAVRVPDGSDSDLLRSAILDHFDLSLGAGFGKVKGKVFRIGHLGDLNDLMLAGTLCGVEMGLRMAGVPHEPGGVTAALSYLAGVAETPMPGEDGG